MENIKDLRLIIGPLTLEQCSKVKQWCDEESTDYKFNDGNMASYIKFTYDKTSQSNNLEFYKKCYPNYEYLTYQQWYDRFIRRIKVLPEKWAVQISNYKLIEDYLINKYDEVDSWFKIQDIFYLFSDTDNYFYKPKYASTVNNREYTEISFEDFKELVLNVKQNKEEIMKKQDFTIEGTTALKNAFVEESRLTDNYPKRVLKDNLTSYDDHKGFDSLWTKKDIHFVLPQDWTKALEYVKEYFKEEPKFKVGDWIVPLKDCDKNTYHTRSNNRPYQIYYVNNDNIRVYNKNGKEDGNGLMKFSEARLATLAEIKSVQTKTLVLGDKQLKIVVSKNSEIEVEGKELKIAELEKLIDLMDGDNNLDSDDWSVTFDKVKIGCCIFTKAELNQIVGAYNSLND